MKFLRYKINDENKYGILNEDVIHELSDNFLFSKNKTGKNHPLNSVKILPPVVPSKIICLGYNYKDLVGEKKIL